MRLALKTRKEDTQVELFWVILTDDGFLVLLHLFDITEKIFLRARKKKKINNFRNVRQLERFF